MSQQHIAAAYYEQAVILPSALATGYNPAELDVPKPSTISDVTVVHISDTHDVDYIDVPAGDILVHSGDFCNRGKAEEFAQFRAFLASQPHPYKLVVCGNHEYGADSLAYDVLYALIFGPPEVADRSRNFLLHDSGASVLGIKFWGSSWNNSSQAWGLSSKERAKRWALIPPGTDILITHQPPLGIFDLAWVSHDVGKEACSLCGKRHRNYEHWGCEPLRRRVEELSIPLHMFGHVHDDVGSRQVGATVFSNAAMDIAKKPVVLTVTTVTSIAAAAAPAAVAAAPIPAAEAAAPTAERGPQICGITGETARFPLALLTVNPRNVKQCTGHCLDLDAGDAEQHTVMLWKYKRTMNQRWQVELHRDGSSFRIMHARQPDVSVSEGEASISNRYVVMSGTGGVEARSPAEIVGASSVCTTWVATPLDEATAMAAGCSAAEAATSKNLMFYLSPTSVVTQGYALARNERGELCLSQAREMIILWTAAFFRPS